MIQKLILPQNLFFHKLLIIKKGLNYAKVYNFALLCFLCNSIKADELSLADSHAPISVMGDHIHKKGEFMFSYRFNHMVMRKMMNGTKKLNLEKSLPNQMDHQMVQVHI